MKSTIYYLQKYKNEETGAVCFSRLRVAAVDGGFTGVKENEYGYGAPVTQARTSMKVYKTAAGAEKALAKYVDSLPCDSKVYNDMAFSRW